MNWPAIILTAAVVALFIYMQIKHETLMQNIMNFLECVVVVTLLGGCMLTLVACLVYLVYMAMCQVVG